MTEHRHPSSLDIHLNDRLRSDDQTALGEVLDRFERVIRQRLRMQLGEYLNEHDLDDVLAVALYRLWKNRFRYDPAKGSLGRWFYLIARSAALDLLRRNRTRDLPFLSSGMDAEAPPTDRPVLSADRRAMIAQLNEALLQLSDVDREIVLTFANAQGQLHWTSDLVEELAMPASTIRSRKLRAMSLLRNLLSQAVAISQLKETNMNPQAVDPESPREDQSKFTDKLDPAIEKFADRLKSTFELRESPRDSSGFDEVAMEWNEALDRKEEQPKSAIDIHQLLKEDFRWYLTLEESQKSYREQIQAFLDRCTQKDKHRLAQSTVARRPLDDSVGKLELALSDIGATIDLAMPEDVRREGKGIVSLAWQGADDAEVRWVSAGPALALFEIVIDGLRTGARLGEADVEFFAPMLIEEIRDVHQLELPEFHYKLGIKFRERPTELFWERACAKPIRDEQLPPWIQNTTRAPDPEPITLEMALDLSDPTLARLVDQTLFAAAREDYSKARELSEDELAQRLSAVEALVDAVAERAQVSKEAVVRSFVPLLMNRQIDTKSSDECAANTTALTFLLQDLTE